MAASQLLQHSSLHWTYGPAGWCFVSPGFHARHHSSAEADRDVNFGVSLALWDRLFGTAGQSTENVAAYGLAGGSAELPKFFLWQQLHPFPRVLGSAATLVLQQAKALRSAAGKPPDPTKAL